MKVTLLVGWSVHVQQCMQHFYMPFIRKMVQNIERYLILEMETLQFF